MNSSAEQRAGLLPRFQLFPFMATYYFGGVLSVAEKFDTSWFDLKNYEALKTMSVEGWQQLLGERYEFSGHVKSCREDLYQYFYEQGAYFKCDFLDSTVPPEELFKKISDLLKQGVITNFGLGSFPLQSTLPNPSKSSINDLVVHDVVEMSNVVEMSYGYRLHYEVDAKGKKKLQKNQENWQEMLTKPFNDGHDGNAKIKIDLYATDAKLRNDFDQWLKNIRATTGYYDNIPKKKSKKKLSKKEQYTQKDFDRWIEYGVIPYIDLKLIADIEYKEISQEELAKKIFPNDPNPDLDTVERIRQVTKPLADELIQNKMYKTLLAQLAYQVSPT
jgi:hypothetical protein